MISKYEYKTQYLTYKILVTYKQEIQKLRESVPGVEIQSKDLISPILRKLDRAYNAISEEILRFEKSLGIQHE